MPALTLEAHEAFAQARFAGKSLMESLRAAGLDGDESTASRLGRTPEVRGRVAELFRVAATQSAYEKREAVQDLLAILHTCPADVTEDSPLCEARMGREGPSYRLPSKLQALSRLIKLMDWDRPEENGEEKRDTMRDLLHAIRTGAYGTYNGDPRPENDEDDSEAEPEDIETKIARIKARLYGPPEGETPEVGGQMSELSGATTLPEDDSSEPSAQPANLKPETRNLKREAPLTPRQEAFVSYRVRGLGVMAAYEAAGYQGSSPNLAWRLNSMPAIKARITEFNGGVETACGYRREDAIGDLVTILRSSPAQAGEHHPLCEKRLTSWGSYHRFPSKLAALTLLARVQGWNAAPVAPHDPDFHLRGFLQRVVFSDSD